MEEMNLEDIRSIAKKKIAEITSSKRDLGIRKHLMLCLLFQPRPRNKDGDWEEERKGSNGKSDHSKAKDDVNAIRQRSKAKRESSKRKQNGPKDGNRPLKQRKTKSGNEDGQKVDPSCAWTCNISSNPMKLVLKKVGPTKLKEEIKHHLEEKYQPGEWDFVYEEVSTLPQDAPIPDPDLSFLEN